MNYYVKIKCDNLVKGYTNLDTFVEEITQFPLTSSYMTGKLAYKWIRQIGKLSKKKNIQPSKGKLTVIGFRSE